MSVDSLLPLRYSDRPAFELVVAGVVVYLLYLLSPTLVWVVLGGVLVFCLYLLIRGNSIASFLLVLCLYGACLAGYMSYTYDRYRLVHSPCTLYRCELTILDVRSSGRIVASVQKYGEGHILLTVPSSFSSLSPFCVGDRLEADIDIEPTNASDAYDRHLWSQRIFTKGNIQHIYHRSLGDSRGDLYSLLLKYRALLISKIEEQTSEALTFDQRSLLYALALGERQYLPTELRQKFTLSGTAHLLAVSGFHLGIIFLFAQYLLSLLIPSRHRVLRSSVLLVVLFLYTLLTGASSSTLRAFLMAFIFISGGILRRRVDPIQAWSLTIVILMWINPFSLGSIGLLLSASAVWGILAWYPALRSIYDTRLPVLRFFTNTLWVSIAAQIGVLPWLLYFFAHSGVVFLWSTLPLTLLCILFIPLSFIFIFFLLAGWVPSFLIGTLSFVSHVMESSVSFFSSHSSFLSSEYSFLHLSFVFVVLYYATLVVFHPILTHRLSLYLSKKSLS